MASITITFPGSQAEIPAALADLRAQIASRMAEVNVLGGAIKSIQATCKHDMSYSRDISGCSEGKCRICGYNN